MDVTGGHADLASLSSLDDRVRARLYEVVSASAEPVGRDEAAAAAGIGRALAVYHLDKLVDAGLLTAGYQRPPGRTGPGAGRPAKVYSRSPREFTVSVPPREYELAARLLVQAVADDPSGQSRAALAGAARRLGTQIGAGGRAPGCPAGSRAHLTAVLRAHGFEPYQGSDHAVRLGNCPFHQLAEQDPGLVCGMNLALIQGVITGTGATGLSPELDPRPGRCCVAITQRDVEDRRHDAGPGS
ncbi:MAG TPA: transcriptional regulator [Streptosporangiaceae bacterium]|jgi:predicted ArsR family transcriptional regulator